MILLFIFTIIIFLKIGIFKCFVIIVLQISITEKYKRIKDPVLSGILMEKNIKVLINGILGDLGDMVNDKEALINFLNEQEELTLELFALNPLFEIPVLTFGGVIPIKNLYNQ